MGIDGGIVFTIRTSEKLMLISEFSFSQNNATFLKAYNFFHDEVDYKVKARGLQWCGLLDYYLSNPYLSIQPGFFARYNNAIPFGDIVYFNPNPNSSHQISSDELIDQISGFDYGPLFGISAGTKKVRLNIRYLLGIRNYFKYIDNYNWGYKLTGSTIHFSITYYFGTNHRLSQ